MSVLYREPKPAPMTWHRVRIRPTTAGFQYKNRSGEMLIARPGQVLEIDRDALDARQKDVERL